MSGDSNHPFVYPNKLGIVELEREEYCSKTTKHPTMLNFKSFHYALLGTCLVLTTLVGSPQASRANSSTNALKQSNNSNSSIQSTCSRRGLRVTHYFETASYRIYICENRQGQDFYNGISKRNGSAIILPLISEEGVGMVAKNGQYEYLITGASLTISRNNRVIKEEQVIRSTIF